MKGVLHYDLNVINYGQVVRGAAVELGSPKNDIFVLLLTWLGDVDNSA